MRLKQKELEMAQQQFNRPMRCDIIMKSLRMGPLQIQTNLSFWGLLRLVCQILSLFTVFQEDYINAAKWPHDRIVHIPDGPVVRILPPEGYSNTF